MENAKSGQRRWFYYKAIRSSGGATVFDGGHHALLAVVDRLGQLLQLVIEGGGEGEVSVQWHQQTHHLLRHLFGCLEGRETQRETERECDLI